jgi:hypothetical protein
MSTQLTVMQNTGSRNVPIQVTRYSGGDRGACVQLTGDMERGISGYIQLNKKDMEQLVNIWQKYIGRLDI